jgi:hypothetical protein
LKNTTDGNVGLPSSSASIVGWPGRTQPTVELDVPKSTPQALAMDDFRGEGARCYQIAAAAPTARRRRCTPVTMAVQFSLRPEARMPREWHLRRNCSLTPRQVARELRAALRGVSVMR